jgi:hypothetical protein
LTTKRSLRSSRFTRGVAASSARVWRCSGRSKIRSFGPCSIGQPLRPQDRREALLRLLRPSLLLDRLAAYIKDKAVLNVLGQYTRQGLRVAVPTLQKLVEYACRPCERERGGTTGSSTLEMSARRWSGWRRRGLGNEASLRSLSTMAMPPTDEPQRG